MALTITTARSAPAAVKLVGVGVFSDLDRPDSLPSDVLDSRGFNGGLGKTMIVDTDKVLEAVNAKKDRVVFILWGASARKKKALIDETVHVVLESPHPSPLSAYRGFFGSAPFSKANAALTEAGLDAVDWAL